MSGSDGSGTPQRQHLDPSQPAAYGSSPYQQQQQHSGPPGPAHSQSGSLSNSANYPAGAIYAVQGQQPYGQPSPDMQPPGHSPPTAGPPPSNPIGNVFPQPSQATQQHQQPQQYPANYPGAAASTGTDGQHQQQPQNYPTAGSSAGGEAAVQQQGYGAQPYQQQQQQTGTYPSGYPTSPQVPGAVSSPSTPQLQQQAQKKAKISKKVRVLGLMSTLGNKVKETVAEVAGGGDDPEGGKKPGVLDRVGAMLDSAGDKVGEVMPDAAVQWKREKADWLIKFKQSAEESVKRGAIGGFDRFFTLATGVISNTIKDKLKDPYMPGFVQDFVDEVVDTFWPDVTTEAKGVMFDNAKRKLLIDHGSPPCCCAGQFLGMIRYYLLPYDRSIWRQLRNPLWLFFMVCICTPFYGVGLISFMLFFFIQDCNDAYSMQYYIVEYKAFQFASLGCFSALVGSVQCYVCLSRVPQNCELWAPRVDIYLLILMVAQVVFIWTAFCLFRSAKHKGGYRFQYDKTKQRASTVPPQPGTAPAFNVAMLDDINFSQKVFGDLQAEKDDVLEKKAAARLTKFLIWDIVMFFLCAGLCCWAFWYHMIDPTQQPNWDDPDSFGASKNWKLSMTLFWIRAFYGLMNFPFVLLRMPIISTVISSAKRTGFNWWGNIVPYIGKEEEDPVPWDPQYKEPQQEMQPQHPAQQQAQQQQQQQYQQPPVAGA